MTSVPYPTAFLPTSIASLVLWLDGTDPAGTGTAPSNGTSVSTWVDKSGNGNNATANGTPATYNTNAIVFAGAQNYGTSLSSTLLTQSAFAVISYTGSTIMDIISVRSTGGSAGLQQIINNGSQVITAYGGGLVVNGSSVPANTIVLYNYTFNSGVNAFIYLNGTQTGTSTGSAISGSGTISIGSYDNRPDAEPFVGNMYELVLFNTVLGTTDRRNVEGYLAQKYGITASLPVGHPGLTQTLFSATPLLRSLAGITSTIRITSIPYFTTFNPINLGSLALWLDASQDATANGVSIASLVDRSGNGNSLTPSGTITAATNFLRGRTVYNFGSSRASKTNFPWQTSFTQIVLVKCNTGNWLSSLVSGGAYLAYIFAGNDNLINVNNFFNPTDSSKAVGTSVFTYAADGVSSWIIFSIGYQSNATTASNYTINGTVRTSATSTAVSSAISATNQLWLNGNGSSTFDSGTYLSLIHI